MELSRITELAKEDPIRKFFSIAHFLTPEALYEAFLSLRKNASAGVDNVTYEDYEKQAQQKIQQLHERLKSKTYRAQRLRRIYIPKEDGRKSAISRSCRRRWSSCSTRAGLSDLLLRGPTWTQSTRGARRCRTGYLPRADLMRSRAGHHLVF
jgi:hypothetical protein